jgi:hypothetical protein
VITHPANRLIANAIHLAGRQDTTFPSPCRPERKDQPAAAAQPGVPPDPATLCKQHLQPAAGDAIAAGTSSADHTTDHTNTTLLKPKQSSRFCPPRRKRAVEHFSPSSAACSPSWPGRRPCPPHLPARPPPWPQFLLRPAAGNRHLPPLHCLQWLSSLLRAATGEIPALLARIGTAHPQDPQVHNLLPVCCPCSSPTNPLPTKPCPPVPPFRQLIALLAVLPGEQIPALPPLDQRSASAGDC